MALLHSAFPFRVLFSHGGRVHPLHGTLFGRHAEHSAATSPPSALLNARLTACYPIALRVGGVPPDTLHGDVEVQGGVSKRTPFP